MQRISNQFLWEFRFYFSPFAEYITRLCLLFVKLYFMNSEYLLCKTLRMEFSYSKEGIENGESLSETLKEDN